MTLSEGMHGGLGALADALQVERIGPMHQAGSDSLLTAQTFFSLIKKNFSGVCDDGRFKGELFGVGTNHTKHKIKYPPPGSTGNGSSGSAYPTLQYSSAVHYPSSQNNNIMHSPATFGYEEGY